MTTARAWRRCSSLRACSNRSSPPRGWRCDWSSTSTRNCPGSRRKKWAASCTRAALPARGGKSSRSLLHRVIGSFRRHAAFPSEGAVGLESIAGVSWSDQWAYWTFGWPAVMVTDTAPFRYPHYHTLRDTPDKLDYERLARVVQGLEGVLRDLASGS